MHKFDTSDSAEQLMAVFEGQDAVVSCLRALGDQYKFIDAAIAANVKLFVPSEFGGDTNDAKAVQAVNVLFAEKVKVESYLKERETKISWAGIATGPFLDWGLSNGFWGFDFASSTATIYGDGEGRFAAASLADIGRSVAALLALPHPLPSEVRNRLIYFDSVTTTQNEILSAVEKFTGKTWKKEYVDTATQVQEGHQLVAAGDFWGGMVKVIRGLNFGGKDMDGVGLSADFEGKGLLDNQALGIEKTESLEEIVQQVVKEKQAA